MEKFNMRKFSMRNVENLDPSEPVVEMLEKLRQKMAARSAQKQAGTYSEPALSDREHGAERQSAERQTRPLTKNAWMIGEAERDSRRNRATGEEDQDGAD